MKITLQINGREQSFSEKELIAKLEELEELKSKETEKATKQVTAKVVQKPTEGEWFEVNPNSIEQSLFEKSREDSAQEITRKLILEAFEKFKNNPDDYFESFKTMLPKKTWQSKTLGELKKMASEKGHHIANWVEQALEWAQRIQNGELWEDICNKSDTANWYRVVVWKDGYARCIGGSRNELMPYPATVVGCNIYNYGLYISNAVPLLVLCA